MVRILRIGQPVAAVLAIEAHKPRGPHMESASPIPVNATAPHFKSQPWSDHDCHSLHPLQDFHAASQSLLDKAIGNLSGAGVYADACGVGGVATE